MMHHFAQAHAGGPPTNAMKMSKSIYSEAFFCFFYVKPAQKFCDKQASSYYYSVYTKKSPRINF